jgi:tubulin polyglutamylase TTLL6/13
VNEDNVEDMCMHLTNYAINKNSEYFIQNEDANKDSVGHKRSLKFALKYLSAKRRQNNDQLWASIKSIIIKTLISAQPALSHTYRSCQPDDLENSLCFEILGFDIMLDNFCKPVLLEVNHSPSFGTDSPLDYKIKSELIHDTMKLLGLSVKRRNYYKQQIQEEQERRILSGKSSKPQGEFKDRLRKDFNEVRDQFEKKNLGGYELIYPSQNEEEMAEYQKLLDGAREVWESQSGIVRKRRVENTDPSKRPFFVSTVVTKNLPYSGSQNQTFNPV